MSNQNTLVLTPPPPKTSTQPSPKIYTIYVITNSVDGKQYVGQTTSDLAKYWKGIVYGALNGKRVERPKLTYAIRKHGPDSFGIEPIVSTRSKEYANQYEIETIARLNTREIGYNICIGGEGAAGHSVTEQGKRAVAEQNRRRVHSAETRKRLSDSHLGKKQSAEWVAKRIRKGLIPWSKGKKLEKRSDEWCRRISQGRKASPAAQDANRRLAEGRRGKPGHKHTAESRAKLKASLTGRVFSKEHVEHMRESFKNRPLPSEELRNRMSSIIRNSERAKKHRELLHASMRGKPGRIPTEEDRRRMSEGQKRRQARRKEALGYGNQHSVDESKS